VKYKLLQDMEKKIYNPNIVQCGSRKFLTGVPLLSDNFRRIMLTLPASLLEEVDGLATLERVNRTQFIMEAMQRYVNECKQRHLREQMKRGYQEMVPINLSLALEGLEAENEAQLYYEKKLAELS